MTQLYKFSDRPWILLLIFPGRNTKSHPKFFYEMDMNSVKFYLGMIVKNSKILKKRKDSVPQCSSPYSY
jgi:hypothetical protein